MNKELPIYVTDTHGFIWYLTDSPKLGKNANECFQEIDQGKAKLLISAIVIAEIIYIVQSEGTSRISNRDTPHKSSL